MGNHNKVVYKHLVVNKEGLNWVAIINRPDSLNSLNSEVLTDLDHLFNEANESFPKTCRGIILTGAGEKAFVAGADIRELSKLDVSSGSYFSQKGQSVFHKIELLPIPVIAAVNGFALGGGFELALACDWIIASDNAKFGLPEVGLGLIPGFGGTVRLSRIIGTSRARQLIFTGDMINAVQAKEMGIATWVGPQTEILGTAKKMLNTILEKAPQSIAYAKKSIVNTFDLDLHQALKFETHQFAELFRLDDFSEGTEAFIAKRKPMFKGI